MITAMIRTIILYFFIIIGLRLSGKRQIGELEPGELVLALMLSDLAAVPMQDFGIPLLAGLVPISTLLALSLLLSQLSFHNLRFRKLVCGVPSFLIREGEIQLATYEERMRGEIDRVIDFQEEIGLDVLVHGQTHHGADLLLAQQSGVQAEILKLELQVLPSDLGPDAGDALRFQDLHAALPLWGIGAGKPRLPERVPQSAGDHRLHGAAAHLPIGRPQGRAIASLVPCTARRQRETQGYHWYAEPFAHRSNLRSV